MYLIVVTVSSLLVVTVHEFCIECDMSSVHSTVVFLEAGTDNWGHSRVWHLLEYWAWIARVKWSEKEKKGEKKWTRVEVIKTNKEEMKIEAGKKFGIIKVTGNK
jgi:hypothetical protein